MESDEKLRVKKVMTKQALFLLVVAVLVFGVGTSYALYSFSGVIRGGKENTVSTCAINLDISEENPINLSATYPISDAKAASLTPYTVTMNREGSNCKAISYTFTMQNLCDVCEKTDNICTSGDNTLNCSSEYLINPDMIKYKVVDTTSNQDYSGSDPVSNMSIQSVLDDATTSRTYEIRLWISSEAGNDDIYVKGSEDKYLVDENGMFVGKNYATRLKIDVQAN